MEEESGRWITNYALLFNFLPETSSSLVLLPYLLHFSLTFTFLPSFFSTLAFARCCFLQIRLLALLNHQITMTMVSGMYFRSFLQTWNIYKTLGKVCHQFTLNHVQAALPYPALQTGEELETQRDLCTFTVNWSPSSRIILGLTLLV